MRWKIFNFFYIVGLDFAMAGNDLKTGTPADTVLITWRYEGCDVVLVDRLENMGVLNELRARLRAEMLAAMEGKVQRSNVHLFMLGTCVSGRRASHHHWLTKICSSTSWYETTSCSIATTTPAPYLSLVSTRWVGSIQLQTVLNWSDGHLWKYLHRP